MSKKHKDWQWYAPPPPYVKTANIVTLKELQDNEGGMDLLGTGAFAQTLRFQSPRTGKAYAIKKMSKIRLKNQG